MLRSSLCDCSHTYMLVKGTITVAEATAAVPNYANKQIIVKNCVLFTNCISTINNMQDVDVVKLGYNNIKLWSWCSNASV